MTCTTHHSCDCITKKVFDLEKENGKLREEKLVWFNAHDKLDDANIKLNEQNQKLREALLEISNGPNDDLEIARKALGREE